MTSERDFEENEIKTALVIIYVFRSYFFATGDDYFLIVLMSSLFHRKPWERRRGSSSWDDDGGQLGACARSVFFTRDDLVNDVSHGPSCRRRRHLLCVAQSRNVVRAIREWFGKSIT